MVIGILAVEFCGQNMTEPDGDETAEHREQNIRARLKPLVRARKVQRLEAERGKSRVTAADARHEKIPGQRADQQPAFRAGVGREEANRKGARDIDQQSAYGESFAEPLSDDAGKPKTSHAAQRATYCNPKIIDHKTNRRPA